ncbi:MAG: membrane protein insertase YidC [Rhodospirillales bacterium]|nr:membrane protein insertase YidC [Rhodospirillales bacterium]
MIDNRNMILAVVLSIAILVGFEMFFSKTRTAPPPDNQAQSQQTPGQSPVTAPKTAPGTSGAQTPQATPTPGSIVPTVPGLPTVSLGVSRQKILELSPRVRISTPRLHGSISLLGGRLDDLTLADYRETLEADSKEIVMLTPKGDKNAYFAEFGWVAVGGQATPGPDTLWQANAKTLGLDAPVTLTWDNGQGLKFLRTFSVDKNFMFTIYQQVVNTGAKAATLHPYGLISRRTTPEVSGFYIIHEGLIGVTNSTLKEIKYEDIKEDGEIKESSKGGWLGITDKYWLTSLVPDQKAQVNARFFYHKESGDDLYQVDYLSAAVTVAPGASTASENRLFAGAKEVSVMDAYNENLGIDRFDLTIDFGWFYFLTKPIFYALLYINNVVQNFGISIILLTIFIKLAFFPLANKSYTSMSRMKKLAPQMTTLRERFADDKQRLNQEMMELYKREKVNPASGCLPILIQIPVFFALYKVLFVNIEMRQAPFFGWIKDLSVADPTTVFNLFGLIPWTPPEVLMIGVWPLIMGITMFLQQKLNPQPTDPMQAKIFLFLPLMFTVMLARFPAGLVIYWAVNNTLSMSQQWLIMKRMGISGKDALK